MRIEKLRLKAFRGATKDVSIDFDPDKKITMIFGENGTGKSTIIDGITFLCDQDIGSLQDRSGASEKKFLVSAGQKPADLLVELKAANDSWSATLSGKNIVVNPKAGYPQLKVLRRAQLSAFIEEEPSKRYARIKEFIETPGIDKSEQSLRDAEKTARDRVEELVRDYSNAEIHLNEAWEKEKKPGKDALSWAQEIIDKDVSDLERQNISIQALDAKVTALKNAVAALQKNIADEEVARNAHAQAVIAQEEQQKSITDGSAELLAVLKEAQSYIQKNQGAKECPVCTSNIDAKTLETDIGARIGALSDLEAAISLVTSRRGALDKAHQRTADSMQSAITTLTQIEAFLIDPSSRIPDDLKPSMDKGQLETANNTVLDADARLAAIAVISNSLESNVVTLKQRMAENQRAMSLQNVLSVHIDTLTKNKAEQAETQALQIKLKAVLAVVERERKQFVESVFDEISQEISTLYEKIHPGESISNVSLSLDPKRRGSLNLIGQFYTQDDVPPQAYFSESHLDTLGICIWLAFTKKFAPPNSILILDDVLTSVDTTHLDRIVHLIDDEAQHFGHVIMTTHYRPWRDRYRMHQAAGSKIHYIELKEWSADHGLLTDTCKPSLQELKDLLDPKKFDRQKIASSAGIFLEFMLDYLALRYAVPVPRKAAQDYMLGELLNAFNNKKRALLRVEHLDASGKIIKNENLGPMLDNFDAIVWIRNKVGCHFSVSGQEASDADVRTFAQMVVELAETLICSDGGDIPSRNKSGSYWQSKSDRCRLYPLQMP
jgi:energy-coupling factor transporter ATP-binding protein EcfA2